MNREQFLRNRILDNFTSLRQFAMEADIPYSSLMTVLSRGIGGASFDMVMQICQKLDIDMGIRFGQGHQIAICLCHRQRQRTGKLPAQGKEVFCVQLLGDPVGIVEKAGLYFCPLILGGGGFDLGIDPGRMLNAHAVPGGDKQLLTLRHTIGNRVFPYPRIRTKGQNLAAIFQIFFHCRFF